jgi:hypothetical protein
MCKKLKQQATATRTYESLHMDTNYEDKSTVESRGTNRQQVRANRLDILVKNKINQDSELLGFWTLKSTK